MSTYFVSDIHGEYDLFMRFLDEIKFSSDDEMIICGDAIDKGKQSVKLLSFIASVDRFKMIIGNHEYYFLKFYDSLMQSVDDADDVPYMIASYFPDCKRIDWDLLDYLESLPLYIDREDFLCVHAGVELDEKGLIKKISEQMPQILLTDRKFKEKSIINRDKTVLFGHTPCFYDNPSGRIIKTIGPNKSGNRFSDFSKVRLDCGVAFTGFLGVLRKEDMQEFYVGGEKK